MATLQLFATVEELNKIVNDLATEKGLAGVTQTRGGLLVVGPQQPAGSLVECQGAGPFFLLPQTEALLFARSRGAFQPRKAGAVQVEFGEVVTVGHTSTLLLSSLSAEDRQHLSFRPAGWLRQLKKRLQRRSGFRFGVEAVNTRHGGGGVLYDDIGYSPAALELSRRGVVWKQFADGNVEFVPTSQSPC
jgi:hypothetical protein